MRLERAGVNRKANSVLKVEQKERPLIGGLGSGGERAAAIYTLIGTAKLNGFDPEAYLREVLLTRIADHPISRIRELLPWNIISAVAEVSTQLDSGHLARGFTPDAYGGPFQSYRESKRRRCTRIAMILRQGKSFGLRLTVVSYLPTRPRDPGSQISRRARVPLQKATNTGANSLKTSCLRTLLDRRY